MNLEFQMVVKTTETNDECAELVEKVGEVVGAAFSHCRRTIDLRILGSFVSIAGYAIDVDNEENKDKILDMCADFMDSIKEISGDKDVVD